MGWEFYYPFMGYRGYGMSCVRTVLDTSFLRYPLEDGHLLVTTSGSGGYGSMYYSSYYLYNLYLMDNCLSQSLLLQTYICICWLSEK